MRVHADWRSDLPRIVDNIPRRMPKRLAEFSDYAIHEASNWLFPKSSSLEANPDSAGFSNLSWPIWIALALLAATAYEAGRLTAGALRDIRVAQQGGVSPPLCLSLPCPPYALIVPYICLHPAFLIRPLASRSER